MKRAPETFEAILDRYQGKVYGVAMAILKNREEAEETSREVFRTVVHNADRFPGSRAFSPWIYRICVNACLMRLRKGRGADAAPIEEFLPAFTLEGAHAGPVEDWSGEAERLLPEQDLGRVIGRLSEELPETYRVVFALCDGRGFSYDETAQVLGLSIASVKSRLHRARLYLRERLGRYLRDSGANCGQGNPRQ